MGNTKHELRIVIAGGGTGGHLFPGIALAQEFKMRDPQNRVMFVGGKRRIAHNILRQWGYEAKEIESAAIMGQGPMQMMGAGYKTFRGLTQSFSILRDFSPHLAVGFGGYSSGSIMLAAHILGMKTVLHEQNVLPGLTNRILSRFVDKIFISFPESQTYFSKKKTILTGNPIRRELLECRDVGSSKEK